jgi:hypothetical protein
MILRNSRLIFTELHGVISQKTESLNYKVVPELKHQVAKTHETNRRAAPRTLNFGTNGGLAERSAALCHRQERINGSSFQYLNTI